MKKTIVIDRQKVKEGGLSVPEVLLLLLTRELATTGVTIGELVRNTVEKGYIRETVTGMHSLTYDSADFLDKILLTGDPEVPKENKVEALAKKLIEIFPNGKKPDTNYYWRCNKKEVTLKLMKFYKLYGKDVDDDTIIRATKAYVDSFNGDYRFMRLLKYFILKQDRLSSDDGGITQISDLATFIENEGQEEDMSQDWTTTLI